MELTIIASAGVVLASVGYYFRDLIYRLFDSPVVTQLLNVTMGLTAREGAEIMIQVGKEILLVIAKTLHLILHIAGQALLLIKNLASVVKVFANVIYGVLLTGNAILQSLIEFPARLYGWLTTPPSAYGYFTTIFYILLISIAINGYRYLTSQRSCKREHHSGTKEQGRSPGSCQS